MQQNPSLPDDILLQIFSTLPTKSVGRCRCLSKSWRFRLSTPQFAKLHLTRKTPNEQQSIILVSRRTQTLHTITPPFVSNAAVRDLQVQRANVVGSQNGLVLLVRHQCEIILLNPVTLQQVIIPLPGPSVAFYKDRMGRMYGFGYDSRSDDYKIVIITAREYLSGKTTTVDIYSVKLGVWRRLDNSPYGKGLILVGTDPGTTVNGAIHWLVCHGVPFCFSIIAFDLADEVFHEVPLPVSSVLWNFMSPPRLYDLGGHLCTVHSSTSSTTVVLCIMKEYGLVESWFKFSITTSGQTTIWTEFRPLCFLGDGKILAVSNSRLLVYGVDDGDVEYVVSDRVTSDGICYCMGSTFTDSLISPADIPWVIQP